MNRLLSSLILGILCCFTGLVFYAFLTQNFLPPQRATFFDDFPNYYFAGKRFMEGIPVYGPLEQDVSHTLGLQGYKAYASDPPFTVLALTPVVLLSYLVSWWCFIALSVVLFFFAITLWLDEYNFSPTARMLLISMSYLSQPFLFLLKKNHFESILLLLFVCGLRAYKRKSIVMSSVYWGLAAGLKLFPTVWFIALPNRSLTKRLFFGCSILLLSLLIGWVFLGTRNVSEFFSVTLPLSPIWQGTIGNYSIISLCTAIGITQWGYPMLILAGLAVLLRWRNAHTRVDIAALSASALLLAPLCWLNYFILLLPACIDAVYQYSMLRTQKTLLHVIMLVLTLFYPPSIELASPIASVLCSFIPLYILAYFAFRLEPLAENQSHSLSKPNLSQ